MPEIQIPDYKTLEDLPRDYRLLAQRMDADESIFFARQLEYVKAKTYDVKFQELKARTLLPVEFRANAGAESITYHQYNQVGMADKISNYADDMPRADVVGKEFISPVRSIGSSYAYNIQEINAAQMTGKPLVARKATAAKRAHMYRENQIAWFGDSKSGLTGFLNNPNITEVVLANDGSGNSKAFSTKDTSKIIRDIVSLPTKVHDISNGVETANTLLLPLDQWNYISNTRLPDTDISIRTWILGQNPHIKKIDWLTELKTAGAGNTTRMICYRYDPDALTLEIPEDFRQLPVQESGLEFVVNTYQRIGGVLIYYPLSIAYADGI